MATLRKSPALQLYEEVFGKRKRGQKPAGLEAHLRNGGSIFQLVEMGVPGLVSVFGLKQQEAQRFLAGAYSLAIYVRRQYIEHRLRGNSTGTADAVTSMVDGPSYERLFPTNFDEFCPPDSLRSFASPAAYAVELWRWIRDRIEKHGEEDDSDETKNKLPIHERRADVAELTIDHNTMYRAESALNIIIPVLETFIKTHGKVDDVEAALIEARYPNVLPSYYPWVTLNFVAKHHGRSVGDFALSVNEHFPFFLRPEAWDINAEHALAHASGLGPYQREILTEPLLDPAYALARNAFYARNFGTNPISWRDLDEVKFFAEQTGLTSSQIEALLAIQKFAPVRSANVTIGEPVPPEAESARSGAVFINEGKHPGISIRYNAQNASFLHRFTDSPATSARYDRMNRKLRLDNWLQLPPEEVDALLEAAICAEVESDSTLEGLWLITDNVVHAIGLFQLLHEHYGCTAWDFAVFIHQLSLYGRGEVRSQFDQFFNSLDNQGEPLKLDNGLFPIVLQPGEVNLTISQLCYHLNIDLQTYHYLAMAIANALGFENELVRNPVVISSFCRLVKLPRMLNITPVEGVIMLTLLGGETWLDVLAGVPHIRTDPDDTTPDALNLIYAMHAFVSWCQEHDLSVLWVLQQLAEPQPVPASDNELELFAQVINLLPAALFTNAALLMASVPPLPGADWLDYLRELADREGLVGDFLGTETQYLAFARERFDRAVEDGLGERDAMLRAPIVERMLTVLLQAREAQASVAKECLAVYTGLGADLALLVLHWTQTSVYQLLREVVDRTKPDSDDSAGRRISESESLLKLLADVRRRSAVVSKLKLSRGVLDEFLEYGFRAWIGQANAKAFSPRTLYYLVVLSHTFDLSEKPAQQLLDYLRNVDKLPDPMSIDATRLAQQAASLILANFFNWSVAEVRECIGNIAPDTLILKNLHELDFLIRILKLARQTNMDAQTIFMVGQLPETIDKPAYKKAAEHALLSLTESAQAPVASTGESPEQLVSVTCDIVGDNYVVANSEQTITFKVTVKDSAGQPVKGIHVRWQSALGSIVTRPTNTQGEMEAVFTPGADMGREIPQFWLDLLGPWPAREITVGWDFKTLKFPAPFMSLVPLGEVKTGDEVALHARAMDEFGNSGRDTLVQWFANPAEGVVIRPRQAMTDSQGTTTVFVSCPAGGEIVFSVLAEGSETRAIFEKIIFEVPTGG